MFYLPFLTMKKLKRKRERKRDSEREIRFGGLRVGFGWLINVFIFAGRAEWVGSHNVSGGCGY